jgi:hypothetical protein
MTQFHSKRLAEAARKWRELVELRRLQYIDLYRSGRWQTMYNEAEFIVLMKDVLAASEVWDQIAPPPPPPPLAPPERGIPSARPLRRSAA